MVKNNYTYIIFSLAYSHHTLHFQVAAFLGYQYPDHFWMDSHQDPRAFQCSDSFGRAKAFCSDAANFSCRKCSEQERASVLHPDAWGEKLQIYQMGCSLWLLPQTLQSHRKKHKGKKLWIQVY